MEKGSGLLPELERIGNSLWMGLSVNRRQLPGVEHTHTDTHGHTAFIRNKHGFRLIEKAQSLIEEIFSFFLKIQNCLFVCDFFSPDFW